MGRLFVIATPIGNLADITYRAVETLKTVDLIAAEDTRHSRGLLHMYAVSTPMVAYHDHNEKEQAKYLVDQLIGGRDIALISDAGTPLISDPGYRLVRAAHDRRIQVVPIPGSCAAIAALSVAGIPPDRFVFEGFLPGRRAARVSRLEQLRQEPRTLIFYESAHRIVGALEDMVDVFGKDRPATLARELTKQYETLLKAPLDEIRQAVATEQDQRKGEFVLVIQGAVPDRRVDPETLRIFDLLAENFPPKKAAALAAKITGKPKNLIYQEKLERKKQ